MVVQLPVDLSGRLFAFPAPQQEHELAALLRLYQQQLQKQEPDGTLLERAEEIVRDRIQKKPLDEEAIRLILFFYRYQKNYAKAIPLLSDYLTQSLPIEEEA